MDGRKVYIAKTPQAHALTAGFDRKYTNVKAVKISKPKKLTVTIQSGDTYKIRASVVKLKAGKKLLSKKHAPKLRYQSSNMAVATVSRSGKITAVASGSCKIYVYAHNGISKAITVKVQ